MHVQSSNHWLTTFKHIFSEFTKLALLPNCTLHWIWFVEWISLQKSKIKVMASVPMEVCKFSSMWQRIVMSHRKPLDANTVSLLTNFIHFSNICVCGCRDDRALHLYNMTVSEERHCFTSPAPYSPSPQHCLPGHEADRADNTNFTD